MKPQPKKLIAPDVSEAFRDECYAVQIRLNFQSGSRRRAPRAQALRAAYDLLSAIICEELITDEDDPKEALFGVMSLLEGKLAGTRYRIK